MPTLNQNINYGLLEVLGWPQELINDYTQIRNDLRARQGELADPNGQITSNTNGFYVKINAPTALWFNPTIGAKTGWVQIS